MSDIQSPHDLQGKVYAARSIIDAVVNAAPSHFNYHYALESAENLLTEVAEGLSTQVTDSSSTEDDTQSDDTGLPSFVVEALGELQRRAWSLRSLIECYQEAIDNEGCSDVFSAGNGLLELADSIHRALDVQVLLESAEELKEKAAAKQRMQDDAS